ncbi:alanyl-tRNA synthetase [Nematocida sp. LUAm3]|nr:alanyl-tRNA synthetase [Nematocida sp. LUAm3]KAI5173589.1 alanyl-tRNA synthetase [Nematocida sp. LUAm2]KAI5176810.1 alanyl-tRNA synthetase [Nematocida sp. LUAm1]
MWTAEKLRATFIKYFEDNEHVHWKSSSVLPDDASLLFTNSGMVQFKKKFLDLSEENTPYGRLTAACNYQKCIRAGGKHNDLDDVGKDTYHHTFFEMLGNWSFGGYFKETAIDLAWNYLTEVLLLDKNRLYVSYFKGDKETNLPADQETLNLWSKYLPPTRILGFPSKENFWEMGATGPCGPCTEIHYDRVGNRDASHLVNMDDPDVIEIWNIVFIQYNREEDLSLSILPKKHIDTGMGLERVLSILQEQRSNYTTDAFSYLFQLIEKETNSPPYSDSLSNKADIAYRVIADHSRTLAISLMDGLIPSSDGRGYVIRRILRRALGFQYLYLKKDTGILPKLVSLAYKNFISIYPSDIKEKSIIRIVEEEEEQFTKTLSKGLSILTEQLEEIKRGSSNTLSGESAFILYDRYGFPVDLTAAVSEQENIRVDMPSFLLHQKAAKELSKGVSTQSSQSLHLSVHDISLLDKITNSQATEDSFKYTETFITGKVIAVKPHNIKDPLIVQQKDILHCKNTQCGVLLDRTSFYSEAGGQEGDKGRLSFFSSPPEEKDSSLEDAVKHLTLSPSFLEVKETKKFGKYVLHIGTLHGSIHPYAVCVIDKKRRKKLAISHTSTHILNHVLSSTLPQEKGSPVQCGSLVSEDKLRFDFSWGSPLTPQEIKETEDTMNYIVNSNLKVSSELLPKHEALRIPRLKYMKDEEYPEHVRVTLIGTDPSTRSSELCGGTHLSNTSEIKKISILSETGISRGVRRIVALCGDEALKAEELAKQIEEYPLSSQQEAQRVRDALDASQIPVLSAQRIRNNLEEFQRKEVAKRKKHFDAEAQRLKEAVKEETLLLFTCHPLKDLLSSQVNKMLSPLVQVLEKEKKHGILIYPADEVIIFSAYMPEAHNALREALSSDISLKIGGKNEKAFGSSKLPYEVFNGLIRELLNGKNK